MKERKRCPICKLELDIGCFHTYFSKQRNKYRVANYCKECSKKVSNVNAKKNYKENRKKKLEYAANYRKKNQAEISRKRNFYMCKYRTNLQDCYVRELLVDKHKFTIEMLNENPELVENRRLIIKIKRKLKTIKEDGKEQLN